MKNQEKDNKAGESGVEVGKLVWKMPELTVISVAETKSGVSSFNLNEGTFYGPEPGFS